MASTQHYWNRHEAVVLVSSFFVAALLIVSRRPDAVLHPQFFAEDGASWYAQAHELGGLAALTIPYRTYLHLVPRLAGWLAQAVPLRAAPLLMNLLAIGIEALPPVFICSSRLSVAIPRRW